MKKMFSHIESHIAVLNDTKVLLKVKGTGSNLVHNTDRRTTENRGQAEAW